MMTQTNAAAAPDLPEEVVARTREKYVEAYERLTGEPFAAWLARA
jgi:phosphoribosylaminoimidazole-succinocarboxamide synthase